MALALTGGTGCTPAAQQSDNDAGSTIVPPNGNDGGTTQQPDAGTVTPPTCAQNPMTYLEFVNSCTTDTPLRPANRHLPRQLRDGGLPPLTDTFDPDAGPEDVCLHTDGGN